MVTRLQLTLRREIHGTTSVGASSGSCVGGGGGGVVVGGVLVAFVLVGGHALVVTSLQGAFLFDDRASVVAVGSRSSSVGVAVVLVGVGHALVVTSLERAFLFVDRASSVASRCVGICVGICFGIGIGIIVGVGYTLVVTSLNVNDGLFAENLLA